MIAGSLESSIEEGDLPNEKQAEIQGVTIWFRIHGLLERMQSMFTRRYPGYGDNGESEYARRLRELEGQIADIDREQHGLRMGDYHKGPRGRENAWKDWILTIVGLLIVAWLARLDSKIEDIVDLKARTQVLEKRQDQTDKHLESTDGRVERFESKVSRGAQ